MPHPAGRIEATAGSHQSSRPTSVASGRTVASELRAEAETRPTRKPELAGTFVLLSLPCTKRKGPGQPGRAGRRASPDSTRSRPWGLEGLRPGSRRPPLTHPARSSVITNSNDSTSAHPQLCELKL